MKTNSVTPSRWRQFLGRLVGASALALLGMTALGQAMPKSPVGTWSFVMSGPREGAALMSFFADGTFTNYEFLVPKAPGSTQGTNIDLRNTGGDNSRTPSSTNSTPSLPANTPIFGSEHTSGPWGFDAHGRVIGFWYEISEPSFSTNALSPSSTVVDTNNYFGMSITNTSDGGGFCVTETVGTNTDGTFTNQTTCYAISTSAVTNQLSFVGTVVPGKHFTLVASSPAGKVTFNGVPDAPLADLSGSWYGVEREGLLSYTEFFTLTRVDPDFNLYLVDGSGPGYSFAGHALLTPQKKLATTVGITPVFGGDTNSPTLIRAVVGPLNMRKFGGKLHGLKGTGAVSDDTRLTYTLQHE